MSNGSDLQEPKFDTFQSAEKCDRTFSGSYTHFPIDCAKGSSELMHRSEDEEFMWSEIFHATIMDQDVEFQWQMAQLDKDVQTYVPKLVVTKVPSELAIEGEVVFTDLNECSMNFLVEGKIPLGGGEIVCNSNRFQPIDGTSTDFTGLTISFEVWQYVIAPISKRKLKIMVLH